MSQIHEDLNVSQERAEALSDLLEKVYPDSETYSEVAQTLFDACENDNEIVMIIASGLRAAVKIAQIRSILEEV